MKKIFQPRVLIYLIVGLIVVSTGAFSTLWQSDIGPNLFSEALGVAFTIFIIEALLRYEEKRRSRPARYAAFREALLIFGRFILLWHNMLRSSYAPQIHKKILEQNKSGIFDVELGNIISTLDLTKDAPVIPKRNWRQHLYEQVVDLENRIDRCLARYANFMEPEMITVLQNLERTSFIGYSKAIISLPTIDAELNVNRGNAFGWGAKGTSEDLMTSLKNMGNLLVKLRPEFSKLEKIPDVIDVEHKDFLDDLIKR